MHHITRITRAIRSAIADVWRDGPIYQFRHPVPMAPGCPGGDRCTCGR